MRKSLLFVLFLLVCSFAFAQRDSVKREHKVKLGVYSSVSYQLAMNGGKARTNLGNFGFKGYLQPEIGLGIRYQQDSTEFALVTLSISRLSLTLSSGNVLYDNGNEYPIINRFDIFLNNYSLEAAYSRRITKNMRNKYLSLELGAGVHVFQRYGISHSHDTAAGPYSITRTLETKESMYAIPSGQVGLNCFFKSAEHKTDFVVGIRSQLYLAKFAEIAYNVSYTSPNATMNYYFRWSPVILTPKVYVMAVF